MRDFRLKALEHFLARPTPTWGSPMLAEIDFDDIHYFVRASEQRRATPGTTCPRTSRTPSTGSASPRPSASSSPASAPSTSPRSSTTRCNEELEKQGVIFTDMDTALREHEDLRARVLRHDHPAQRQQARGAELGGLVGRLVRLRPAGRQRRDAAAGLLPDQHREHGPVRADADHRRGGLLRALRRGLHGADVLEPTRCTRPWSRSSPSRAPGSATRRSRTGRHNVFNLVTKRAVAERTRRWSGSTATSAPS